MSGGKGADHLVWCRLFDAERVREEEKMEKKRSCMTLTWKRRRRDARGEDGEETRAKRRVSCPVLSTHARGNEFVGMSWRRDDTSHVTCSQHASRSTTATLQKRPLVSTTETYFRQFRSACL